MKAKFVETIWVYLSKYKDKTNYILLTDENIFGLYRSDILESLGQEDSVLVLKSGEENKNWSQVSQVLDFLIEKNINRQGQIIALGGGIIGDIGGFTASIYKRGIEYIQIPTTLLSQVDSSIGGKTGFDYGGYKNLVGSFYFPKETLIDINFLRTLAEREIISGLGEVIKYGIIYEYKLLAYIKDHLDSILNKDLEALAYLVKESVPIKEAIVSEDKFDKGLRQILNFGHTIGHGLESMTNYNKYSHGQAVIIGMVYESLISYKKDFLDRDYLFEILGLLGQLVDINQLVNIDFLSLLPYLRGDKKNIENTIAFILPTERGKVHLHYLDEDDLLATLKWARSFLEEKGGF